MSNVKIDPVDFKKHLVSKLKRSLSESLISQGLMEGDEYFIDPDNQDSGTGTIPETHTVNDENASTDEQAIIDELIEKANSAGANVVGYEHGVFHAEFDAKDAVDSFIEYLETNDKVENFELNFLSDANLYQLWVYLDSSIVSYDYFNVMNDDEDESDEDEELERTDKEVNDELEDNNMKEGDEFTLDVNEPVKTDETPVDLPKEEKPKKKGHKMKIKTSCKPGFKYDPKSKACVKVEGDSLKKVRVKVKNKLKRPASEVTVEESMCETKPSKSTTLE